MSDLRKTQILRDGQWLEVEFKEIKNGDKVRLFEPTGEPVKTIMGVSEWTAMSDAYLHPTGVYAIQINEVE